MASRCRKSSAGGNCYEGNWTAQPDVLPHELLTMEAKRKASKQHTKLLGLFKTYSADKKLNDCDTRGVRKTLDGYEATLKQLIELCGDLPIEKIKPRLGMSFEKCPRAY
jgi:hypothetical protein